MHEVKVLQNMVARAFGPNTLEVDRKIFDLNLNQTLSQKNRPGVVALPFNPTT